MTETDVPDYDAMSPSDRAFALFTAVEAARSEAIAEMREAGREIDRAAYGKAHQAALAVWNAWAEPLLEEREALEEAGTWVVNYQFSSEFPAFVEIGQNPETQDFLHRADINARSITFIAAEWVEENKRDGEEKVFPVDTEPSIKTIFCETIFLAGFSFPGNASFHRAAFKGNANFVSTIFNGNADFINATFNGNAEFIGTTFKGDADFNSVKFRNDAYFNNSVFKGYASFLSAEFHGNTHFKNADCKSYASYSYATFKKDTSFFNTAFGKDADFNRVNVQANVSFDTAKFKASASFSPTNFKGHSSFRGTQFEGEVNFVGTTFKEGTTFLSSVFKSYAYYGWVHFEGDVDFSQVDFLSHANFYDTTFLQASDWTALNAARGFNMAGARFETRVPQFTQAHFTESPRVDNVELPEPGRGHSTLPAPKPDTGWITTQVHSWSWAGGAPHDDEDSMRPTQAKWEELEEDEELGDAPDGETRREIGRDGKRYRYRERKLPKPKTGKPIDADDIAAFTALRRIAMQGEDHETERKAFKGEMRTRRVAGGLGPAYNISSWAYDLFTSFGASFMRPLFLWLFLTLASAGIYAVAANGTKPAGCDTPITSSAQLSLHNALLFATAGQRTFVQDAQICLYGQDAKTKRSMAPAWLGIFGTVQTLLSAMLIFFILLALRNRFKI